MFDGALVLFTSYLAQAGGAVVLALILARFYRLYRHDYLRTWAWSWWALCVYLVSAAFALWLSAQGSPVTSPGRIVFASLYLVAGYWQVAWLLFGTYEVTMEQRLGRRTRGTLLALLAVLGIASGIVSLTSSEEMRFLARVGVRPLCLALAFFGASYGLWRHARDQSGLGRKIVTASFLVYGLHQLQYLAVINDWLRGDRRLEPVLYLAPFDFLLMATMGLGMVIWLLEEERRQMLAAAAQIEHLAVHDALTGLPNRHQLLQSLGVALRRARRREGRLAVLFLNIDRFKSINDSLGHGCGDDLVREIAARLRGQLRSDDLLARVSADEFALLIPAVEGADEIVPMAERVLNLIRRPFLLEGREIHVTASLGVSRFPEDDSEAEELLRRSGVAMHRAKDLGRDQLQVYAPDMEVHSLDQLSLENELRRAMDQDELELFYQPIVDACTCATHGVEALLRWRHPQRGLLLPAEFLPLAEATGLSGPFDLWVLRTACREARAWQREGLSLRVAVNLSARSFQNPELPARVSEILAEAGLPARCLELEITETLAMKNAEAALAVLRELKELEVRLSIDDFGTGYSSLSYLTDFPIDTLKVDRSFVCSLGTQRGSEEVAAAVIALAHSLGIGVVAEGVEEERQRRILQEQGCDELQGYLFSRPLPAAEHLVWLRTGSAAAQEVRRPSFG